MKKNPSHRQHSQVLPTTLLAAMLAAGQSAQATTYTWNTNTSGALWSASGSWVGAAVPTFVAGDTFDLSTRNITVNGTTSTMDTVGGNTLGTIKIGDTNNTHTWTLGLTTALTLDGNGAAATINQISTSKGDTINGAGGIILASDLNLTNASGNILNISTGITATGATRTITNNGSGFGRVNLNSAIGSGINLVQNSTNSATWMLASSASFNGTITVKAGTFQVGATGANGIGLGSAAFTLGDTSGSSDAALVFLSGNGSGYAAPITVASGSSGIKSIIGGVTSGNNTYFLNSAITLGADSSHTADVTIGNSSGSTSTYNVQGGFTGFGNVTVKTTGTGRTRLATTGINNTGTLTNAGTGSGVAQIDAVVGTNVTGVVQNSSTSQMNLAAANTYTGATTVTLGTLSVGSLANGGSNSNIGASTNVAGNLILNGGTLKYTGAAVSTDRLFSLQSSSVIDASGSGAVNFTNTGSMGFNGGTAAKTLTLTGTSTGANTIAAVIGDNTGATGLTKSGAGTWVLSGANTYTGATTISGGTLALGSAGSISNTSGVSLGTVGTFDVSAKGVGGYTVNNLTGSGNVTGALTVSTQLAIGNSPGTVNFSSSLTLGSGSTSIYELTGGGTTGDLGDVAGDLSINAGAILDLVQLGTYTANDKFTLFAYDGALAGNFSGLADDTVFAAAGGAWLINYNDTAAGLNGGAGTSYVTVTAVPEPGAALLGGFGVLALLRRRRN